MKKTFSFLDIYDNYKHPPKQRWFNTNNLNKE